MYTEAMQRRGFLSFLAVLPGLSFLGGPAPAKVSVEPPKAPKGPRGTCDTTDELFQKILDFVRTYPGAEVLAFDDYQGSPGAYICFTGFAARIRQEGYEISIAESMSRFRLNETGTPAVLKTFSSGAGRRWVAHILSQGGSLYDVYSQIYHSYYGAMSPAERAQWRASRGLEHPTPSG